MAGKTDQDIPVRIFPTPLSNIEDKEEPSVKTQSLPLSSKIFKIRFSYLQNIVRLNVLKVWNRGDESMYKILLGSKLSKSTGMCWLQHRQQDWIILLGHELDEKLKRAITSAIECQEF